MPEPRDHLAKLIEYMRNSLHVELRKSPTTKPPSSGIPRQITSGTFAISTLIAP